MRVSVTSNDASLRLPISVVMISSMQNVAGGYRAVLQSFILDGIPHKEGGWHIERPWQIQPPTVADGWFVSKQTFLTQSKATLSQARSHWPWLKHVITHQDSGMNFVRFERIIGQIPYTVYCINSTANHSRSPQYISQHSRGIQLLAMPPPCSTGPPTNRGTTPGRRWRKSLPRPAQRLAWEAKWGRTWWAADQTSGKHGAKLQCLGVSTKTIRARVLEEKTQPLESLGISEFRTTTITTTTTTTTIKLQKLKLQP